MDINYWAKKAGELSERASQLMLMELASDTVVRAYAINSGMQYNLPALQAIALAAPVILPACLKIQTTCSRFANEPTYAAELGARVARLSTIFKGLI